MSRPAPVLERSQLLPAGSYTQGNKEAKTYLVEFSDFQCPACRSFQPQVKALVEKNKDKLVFAYRHFPLTQHPLALPAALAAEAAGEQEKFWEMHDYIFENQESLSEEILLSAPEKLGLDKEKYLKAFKDKKYQDKIDKDTSDGRKFGVDATPTFFLNGKKLDLFTSSDLSKSVEETIKNNPK
ncbi:hypothetical protein A2153_04780 [Candidatus Gottesmanbacteria bacterium RBG_16_38_7b]|uniref:Thioredoxin domain-containing protein n=1 Tax=Candidatus Gottesmanbacteria bacterium RBG_16_38_7b TaxID=1798372 RepID=A0A1F5YJE8_9BACT|nr:MAG: hypothetical protein A2153_04780 [Candidatus Gottesmanbacteria bacterium RBG_16_38_7b]